MKRILLRIVLMVQFLTTIPLRFNLNANEEDYGKGLAFAPLVGLLIGAILSGVFYLLGWMFPPVVASVIIVITYILLTGGLHLDGLGDTFDGLFSNRPKDKIMEIMKDSRVGTYAVLVLFCILALNITLINSIDGGQLVKILILFPIAGRTATLIGASICKYARSSGLGKSFVDYCGIKQMIIGSITFLLAALTLSGWKGLIMCGVIFCSSAFTAKLLARKIGGVTGDILGAVCELNQTIFLIGSYLLSVQ